MRCVLVALALILCVPTLAGGVTGQASRSIKTEAKIATIAARIAGGAVKNGFATEVHRRGIGQLDRLSPSGNLRIDGADRDGFGAWCEAIHKVSGFVFDTRTAGSVEFRHVVRVQGTSARVTELIQDGLVQITVHADFTDTVSTKKPIPIHIVLVVTAREVDGFAYLSGTATGTADLSAFRCGLVQRIVGRVAQGQIAKSLDSELLAVLEDGGRKLYADGDPRLLIESFIKRLKGRRLVR
jgi:hypothetical protein